MNLLLFFFCIECAPYNLYFFSIIEKHSFLVRQKKLMYYQRYVGGDMFEISYVHNKPKGVLL